MSNYWSLACDCGDSLNIHANHGEQEIAKLADAASSLAKLGTALPDVAIDLKESFSIYGENVRTVRVGWFTEHTGHRMRAKSEYGYFFGECGKPIDYVECGVRSTCKRVDGHDGFCSRVSEPVEVK